MSQENTNPIEGHIIQIYRSPVEGIYEVKTDCVFWGHLVAFLEVVSDMTSTLNKSELQVIRNAFLGHLARRIETISQQTVLFEYDVEREWRGSVDYTLADHVQKLKSSPEILCEILEIYSGLATLLASLVSNAAEAYNVFVAACETSLPHALALFSGKGRDVRSIGWCRIQDSDPHGRGKSVIFIGENPGKIYAVYKPRNLTVEKTITELLRKVSAHDKTTLGWLLPEYFSAEDHGWMGYVRHRCTINKAEVDRYYYRSGFFLALCHILGITDCHRDNLLANGDSPCPVDMEAALHHLNNPSAPSREGRTLPVELEWNSMSTGLLPTWSWKGNDFRGVDLSGFGSLNLQWCSIPLPQVVRDKQFGDRILKDGVSLLPGRNRVFLQSTLQFPWQNIQTIQEGFESGMRLLPAYINEENTLCALRNLSVRFLARPTAAYHYTINASTHPRYLQSTKLRSEFISECFLSLKIRLGHDILEAEEAACMLADIPRFETVLGEQLVVRESATGQKCFLPKAEFLQGEGEVSRRLLHPPSSTRITFEKRLISGSLLALSTHYATQMPSQGLAEITTSWTALDKLQVASLAKVSLKGRIFKDYVEGSVQDQWLGFRASPDGCFEFNELGVDLYSGVSGILYGLSLDSSGIIVSERKYQALMLSCVSRTKNELQMVSSKVGGAYFGPLSAVLPLIRVCRNFGESSIAVELASLAFERLKICAKNRDINAFWGTDLSGGIAGAIAVAASLVRLGSDNGISEFVGELLNILISKGRWINRTQFVWPQLGISVDSDAGLCGLAHGNSGTLISLAEIRSLNISKTLDQKIDDHIAGALEWELSHFHKYSTSWPDLRGNSGQSSVIPTEFAWCHGAPGILFALLRTEKLVQSPGLKSFLMSFPFQQYFKQLTNSPKPRDGSLCHGGLGTYAITKMLLTSVNPELLSEIDLSNWCRISDWGATDCEINSPPVVRSPGLMIGSSGSLAFWCGFLDMKFDRLPFLPFAFEN